MCSTARTVGIWCVGVNHDALGTNTWNPESTRTRKADPGTKCHKSFLLDLLNIGFEYQLMN